MVECNEYVVVIFGAQIVVDFTATWCGPCRQMAPTFALLSIKYKGDLIFVKVDVDQLQASPFLVPFARSATHRVCFVRLTFMIVVAYFLGFFFLVYYTS